MPDKNQITPTTIKNCYNTEQEKEKVEVVDRSAGKVRDTDNSESRPACKNNINDTMLRTTLELKASECKHKGYLPRHIHPSSHVTYTPRHIHPSSHTPLSHTLFER